MVLQLKCGSFAWDIVFQSFAKTDLSFFPGETRTSIQPDFLPVPDIFKPFCKPFLQRLTPFHLLCGQVREKGTA